VRGYLDGIRNLFAIGRNGMHRYNNQDHSMLAAKAAVDCLANSSNDKSAIWAVNTEEDYHETRRTPGQAAARIRRPLPEPRDQAPPCAQDCQICDHQRHPVAGIANRQSSWTLKTVSRQGVIYQEASWHDPC